MRYIDCFVAAVPTANKEAFREHAHKAAEVFKEYGAESVVDAWGDAVPDGEVTSLPMAVKCQPDETVVFGWVAWPSRAARDEVWETVMADPRMHFGDGKPPFDGRRMIFGGFEALVDL